ncbi:31434_t:CDS:2, partial [Gigaspora margarita]
ASLFWPVMKFTKEVIGPFELLITYLYKHEVPALLSHVRSCIVIAIASLAMATEPTVLINNQTH